MSFTGTHTLGPETATLTVRTGKKGAASKAGHNLRMQVGAWSARLALGEDGTGSELTLTADSRSFTVLEGTGGVKPLADDDKANIRQTIDDEVLKGGTIAFHSTTVTASPDASRLSVQGELDLLGTPRPLRFDLTLGEDGRLSGTAVVKQTDWGMKPYSALFGALKVADEVEVTVEGRLGGG
jgi:polyisoprenoid-binding protein YceI